MLKPNPNMVGTKTIEFFINKPEGVRKEEVIEGLIRFVNIRKKDAEDSIKRAVGLGEIQDQNGILKLMGFK